MNKLLIALCLLTASAFLSAADRPVETLYNQYCTICHAMGVANAPKTHDVDAWKPKLAKSDEAMLEIIHNGLNAMPPKGMCPDCTDSEYLELIKFMSTAKE